MEASATFRGRLFRHDCRIGTNIIRNIFAAWSDRLIAAVMLFAALAIARSWFEDQPWEIAAWAMLGAGIVIGSAARRLVAARLAFHSFDGVLAADALHKPTRILYVVACHGIGIALLSAITLIARPSLLFVSIAAYGLGILLAGSAMGVAMTNITAGRTSLAWAIRSWLQRPETGIAAAVLLLVALLPAIALGANMAIAVAGVASLLLALSLTSVDDTIVRFMTITGHGSLRILVHHMKGIASFVVLGVPGCWLISGPVSAVMAAAASIAALFLLTLRILAYRVYSKRSANFIVSIVGGVVVLVTFALPLATPIAAIAIIWQLQRRGIGKTWLLT